MDYAEDYNLDGDDPYYSFLTDDEMYVELSLHFESGFSASWPSPFSLLADFLPITNLAKTLGSDSATPWACQYASHSFSRAESCSPATTPNYQTPTERATCGIFAVREPLRIVVRKDVSNKLWSIDLKVRAEKIRGLLDSLFHPVSLGSSLVWVHAPAGLVFTGSTEAVC